MLHILAAKSGPTVGLCLHFLGNYLQCLSQKAKVQRMKYFSHDKLSRRTEVLSFSHVNYDNLSVF